MGIKRGNFFNEKENSKDKKLGIKRKRKTEENKKRSKNKTKTSLHIISKIDEVIPICNKEGPKHQIRILKTNLKSS